LVSHGIIHSFPDRFLPLLTSRSFIYFKKQRYAGEIGFFDNYVIPLAKKLKECGVFGVSSDEYLNYALQNRNEWEERGLAIVQSMTEQVNAAVSLEKDQGKEEEDSPNSNSFSSIVV